MTTAKSIRSTLTDILDHHWLKQGVETGTAYCTCGTWGFDARSGQHPLPVVGERFRPFSEHVALIVLDDVLDELAYAVGQDERDAWANVQAFIAANRLP